MKKIFALILIIFVTLSFAGCGKKDDTSNTKSAGETATASTDNKKSASSYNTTPEMPINPKPDSTDDTVIDLSSMSTTMAYSQAVEMTNNRKNYIGKAVKMTGTFVVATSPERNYYICNIGDTTACCSVGFEFSLSDTELKYPDDYPKVDEKITVQGIFTTYNEGKNEYIELKDAVFVK